MHRRLREKAWEFCREWQGRYLIQNGDLGPNDWGAQCVNVANEWWRRIGLSGLAGNAGDWAGGDAPERTWLEASPRHHFVVGDVAIWRGGPSEPWGHVALVLDGSHWPLVTLDQNWPSGSPVHEQRHIKSGVAGVLRPDRIVSG